jgi:prophage regulatory protein
MQQNKSHYPLREAAELAKCKPEDLLHYAVQRKIALLVGVPDWVDVRVYDGTTNLDVAPFLMTPQLFVLAQSHCLKIEINGKTKQSDFPEGFFIGSSGALIKILPSYGLPVLNHEWVYWRTYRERMVNLIELVPERLFVVHSDLVRLNGPEIKPKEAEGLKARKSKAADFMDISNVCISLEASRREKSANNALSTISDQCDLETEGVSVEQPKKYKLSESLLQRNVMLRLKQVQERTGLSRSTIYNKMNPESEHHDPAFPKQVQLSTSSVGWVESELQVWIDCRVANNRRKC